MKHLRYLTIYIAIIFLAASTLGACPKAFDWLFTSYGMSIKSLAYYAAKNLAEIIKVEFKFGHLRSLPNLEGTDDPFKKNLKNFLEGKKKEEKLPEQDMLLSKYLVNHTQKLKCVVVNNPKIVIITLHGQYTAREKKIKALLDYRELPNKKPLSTKQGRSQYSLLVKRHSGGRLVENYFWLFKSSRIFLSKKNSEIEHFLDELTVLAKQFNHHFNKKSLVADVFNQRLKQWRSRLDYTIIVSGLILLLTIINSYWLLKSKLTLLETKVQKFDQYEKWFWYSLFRLLLAKNPDQKLAEIRKEVENELKNHQSRQLQLQQKRQLKRNEKRRERNFLQEIEELQNIIPAISPFLQLKVVSLLRIALDTNRNWSERKKTFQRSKTIIEEYQTNIKRKQETEKWNNWALEFIDITLESETLESTKTDQIYSLLKLAEQESKPKKIAHYLFQAIELIEGQEERFKSDSQREIFIPQAEPENFISQEEFNVWHELASIESYLSEKDKAVADTIKLIIWCLIKKRYIMSRYITYEHLYQNTAAKYLSLFQSQLGKEFDQAIYWLKRNHIIVVHYRKKHEKPISLNVANGVCASPGKEIIALVKSFIHRFQSVDSSKVIRA